MNEQNLEQPKQINMTSENAIKSLIKADLKLRKLDYVLESVGFLNDNFDLGIIDTVLEIMEINDHVVLEEAIARYLTFAENMRTIKFRFQSDELDNLANDIYHYLLLVRKSYQ